MSDRAQYMGALEKANVARLEAAEIKREVAAGETSLRVALVDERASSVQVGKLLLCVPRVGTGKARDALACCQISERKRVGDLTARQRRVIFERLR